MTNLRLYEYRDVLAFGRDDHESRDHANSELVREVIGVGRHCWPWLLYQQILNQQIYNVNKHC